MRRVIIDSFQNFAGTVELVSAGCCGEETFDVLSTQKDGVLRVRSRGHIDGEEARLVFKLTMARLIAEAEAVSG